MILRPYYYFDLGCAAYLFGCGTLGRCAVVDARVDDVDAYAAFAASKGMRITHAIDTHVHADHRSGSPSSHGDRRAVLPPRVRRCRVPVHGPRGRRQHRARKHPRQGPAHARTLSGEYLPARHRSQTRRRSMVRADRRHVVRRRGRQPDLRAAPARTRPSCTAAFTTNCSRYRATSRFIPAIFGVRLRHRNQRQADEHDRVRATVESDAVAGPAGVHRRHRRCASKPDGMERVLAFNRGGKRPSGAPSQAPLRSAEPSCASACVRTPRNLPSSSSSTPSSGR